MFLFPQVSLLILLLSQQDSIQYPPSATITYASPIIHSFVHLIYQTDSGMTMLM